MSIIEGAVQRGLGIERGPGAGGQGNSIYYVDANNGDDDNGGSRWGDAFATIGAALAVCGEGDTIMLSGKFREELTLTNTIGGVHFLGAAVRLPAHADSPWPSGASWLPPASPTAATPLIKVRSQGVTFENILFDCPVDAAAILLQRNALSGDSEYDGSHAHIINCRFTSGQSGIENDGGCGFVIVEGCRFYDLTDGIKCLNTAVAVPLRWIIRNNEFLTNTNHIQSSFSQSVIRGNTFMNHTTCAINPAYNSSQGSLNVIWGNYLSGTYQDVDYVPGTNNEWAGNFNSLSGGVTAIDPA